MKKKTMIDTAIELNLNNIFIIPLSEENKPLHKGKRAEFIETLANSTPEEQAKYYKTAPRIAVNCDNGIVALDVDSKTLKESDREDFNQLVLNRLLSSIGESNLYDRLYIESTPNDGLHIFFKVAINKISQKPNKTLAYTTQRKPLIELKYNNDLCNIYPSPKYDLIQGCLADLPIIPINTFQRMIKVLEGLSQKKELTIVNPESTKENKVHEFNLEQYFTYNKKNETYSIAPYPLMELYRDTKKGHIKKVINGRFMVFNGKIWDFVHEEYIKAEMYELIVDIVQKDKIRPNLVKEAVSILENYSKKNILLSEELNKNPFHMVFEDGTYDIKTDIFHEGIFFPDDNKVFMFNFDFPNPTSTKNPFTYQLFYKTMNEWMCKDEEQIALLQEIMGYCLYPDIKNASHKTLYFMLGDGENGKNVFLNIMKSLVGQINTCSVGFENLEDKFELATLHNKLINIVSETPANKTFNSNVIKSVCSGDLNQACFKFKDSFTFHPFAKHFFAVNELPKINDTTHGMFRRIIAVKWDYTPPVKNKNLENDLLQELRGIMGFALIGLKRLIRNDFEFTHSEKAEITKTEYVSGSNSVQAFINAKCIVEKGNNTVRIPCKKLYQKYVYWCEEEGYTEKQILKKQGRYSFLNQLKNRGVDKVRNVMPTDFEKTEFGVVGKTDFYTAIYYNEEE